MNQSFFINESKKGKEGFTLMEILIVVGIIALLAAAVLTSISGQRQKAQVNKVLAEISARLQPMMMCWSDGGSVQSVASGSNICNLSGYGTWPVLPADFSVSYSVNDSASWCISIIGGGAKICCNSTTSQCGVIGQDDTCDNNTPSSF